MKRKTVERIFPWLIVTAFLLLWELAIDLFKIPKFVLPRPSEIAVAMVQYWSAILYHSAQTFMTTLVGFIVAVAVGTLCGLLIGGSSLIYAGFYPILVALNSVPKVALLPILVIWFGIGTVPAVISAFIISVFPIIVNVATGVSSVEPELRDVLRSLRAKHYQILIKIGIPRSLPYLFASLKVAITLAFVGSIMAETIAANRGIGYLMMTAASRFDVPLVFAGLTLSAVMGTLMYLVCVLFESRMTRWAFRA